MSPRVLWTVRSRSASGPASREWECATLNLRRIAVLAILAWTVLAVAGAIWSGHRERMARVTLERERRENRILRERQAALRERTFDLAARVDAEGARLGVSESRSVLVEAEQACEAAQYALDSAPPRTSLSDPSPRVRLDCAGLARRARPREASNLRAAMWAKRRSVPPDVDGTAQESGAPPPDGGAAPQKSGATSPD